MSAPRNWRQRLLELYAVVAGVVTGALIFERHRVSWTSSSGDWGRWHSLAVEAALLPFLLVALVVPACLWARRRAPRGLLAAAVGLAAAFALFVMMALAHLFEDVQSNDAAGVVAVGGLVLAVGALVLFVSEPLAAHRARQGRGPALRDVALTGGRRTLRTVLIVATSAVAVLLVLLLLVERHTEVPWRDYEAPPRREWFVRDTWGLVLLGPVLVLAAMLRARRGFPHGVVAGLVAFLAGLAMLMTWALMNTITRDSEATDWALLAMGALMLGGPAFAIVDGVLHVVERRRTDDPGPTLPTARLSR